MLFNLSHHNTGDKHKIQYTGDDTNRSDKVSDLVDCTWHYELLFHIHLAMITDPIDVTLIMLMLLNVYEYYVLWHDIMYTQYDGTLVTYLSTYYVMA